MLTARCARAWLEDKLELFVLSFVAQPLHDVTDKGDEVDRFRIALQAAIVGFAHVQQVLKEPAEVLGRAVGFGDKVSGALVDGGGGGVEREAKVAFDRRHRGTHLVAGGANELGFLAFLGLFLRHVTKDDDDSTAWLAADGRNDE